MDYLAQRSRRAYEDRAGPLFIVRIRIPKSNRQIDENCSMSFKTLRIIGRGISVVVDSTDNASTILEARDEARLNGRAGFAFLVAFGLMWLVAGVSSLLLPLNLAALVFLFQGAVGAPLAFALEKLLGYTTSKENVFNSLFAQVAMSQLPAALAVVLVYGLEPYLVPAALAAVVGGHLLPYIWINKSRVYGVMAVTVAGIPFLMAVVLGRDSFYYVGFWPWPSGEIRSTM